MSSASSVNNSPLSTTPLREEIAKQVYQELMESIGKIYGLKIAQFVYSELSTNVTTILSSRRPTVGPRNYQFSSKTPQNYQFGYNSSSPQGRFSSPNSTNYYTAGKQILQNLFNAMKPAAPETTIIENFTPMDPKNNEIVQIENATHVRDAAGNITVRTIGLSGLKDLGKPFETKSVEKKEDENAKFEMPLPYSENQ